jgi:aminocarboxymuconate-semialdehyde decarboxylase
MDALGIDVHVLSPVPITLTYWADTTLAVEFSRRQNDLLAAAMASHPHRFQGFASVPLPDVDAAMAELERAVSELGLAGVEIGAEVAGLDLDDASLRPFFAAAEALDVPIFVHPLDGGGGAIRRAGAPYDFGLGMLTDTAMAAAALVLGGVLDDHPGLRVCLAHGCGTFPWALPRLARGASMLPGAGSPGDVMNRARSLWCDSLLFEPAHLPVLFERLGADHVVLGSDFPFYPPAWGAATDVLEGAVERGLCTKEEAAAVVADNGWRFLGSRHQDIGRNDRG